MDAVDLIELYAAKDSTEHLQTILSCILISTNVAIIWLSVYSADRKRKEKIQTQLQSLFDTVEAAERKDKGNYGA